MSDSSDEEALEFLEQLSDWENDDSEGVRRRSKVYQPRVDLYNKYDDYDFVYRFRLNKVAVSSLLTDVYPFLRVTSKRNHGISALHQVLLTLRFYALGTMLVSVADFVGVSTSSASRIVRDVSNAIGRLYSKYVFIRENTEPAFYSICGFPRVLGALDGTHILMQSPSSQIGEEFRNRKSVFSLNVQAVCNAELILMNVVARWPGSAHDATIFNNSALRANCENGHYGNRWLLADSAYPCKPYLLTPVLNPRTPSEENYNRAHIRTRNTIERCFGVWKRRFPALSLKIRLSLPNTQAVIISTAVLHNICREMNVMEVEPEPIIPNHNIQFRIGDAPEPNNLNEIQQRQGLIENFFSRLQ